MNPGRSFPWRLRGLKMNSDGKEKKKTGKARRILALICLFLMAGLVIGLLWAAFTHAPKGTILAFLFALMAVPFVFYACITYLRHKEEYLEKLMEKEN